MDSLLLTCSRFTQFFICWLLLFSFKSYSQDVSITDPNFLQALIDENVDTNMDGIIQVEEALVVNGISFGNKSIENFEGIQAFTNLEYFYAPGNLFRDVDLSHNSQLIYVYICDNPNLEYINVKNGNPFLNSNCDVDLFCIYNCPNLTTICANPEDIACIESDAVWKFGIDNALSISAFCGNGGGANLVRISTSFDAEDNDCTSDSYFIRNISYNLTSGAELVTYVHTNGDKLNVTLPNGIYTITPLIFDPECFTLSPALLEIEIIDNTIPTDISFCISSSKELNDLEVNLIPKSQARAGISNEYIIEVRNTGTTVSAGQVIFNYDETTSSLLESDPPIDGSNTNQLIWETGLIAPFENKKFVLDIYQNGPMDLPALESGDTLSFNAIITSSMLDLNTSNDTSIISQIVVNSFDPNDKSCLNGSQLYPSEIGDYLTYRIRFENLGTAEALVVKILDTLDTNVFIPETLQVVESSHNMITTIDTIGVVSFEFPNINLPYDDENNDGFVIYKIRISDDLEIGDVIGNKAAIYFDSNFPVITNVAVSVIIDYENYDFDYDGYVEDDCDNLNANVNPGQEEIFDNFIDDDCDPLTLDSDLDQDGFSSLEGDCDDSNPNVNPGEIEIPYNGLDDDCDWITQDDDLDNDAYFVLTEPYDCDDSNVLVNPEQIEIIYDGLDNDCDSLTLDDDLDADGFLIVDDCNDYDSSINPAAIDIPNNGIDEDCDGMDLLSALSFLSDAIYKIYPNPSADFVNIDFNGHFNYQVCLYNLQGKQIRCTKNVDKVRFNTLTNGTYFLVIEDLISGLKMVERIVVIK